MQQPNFPLQSLIGVGLQLILSHLVAALIALWLAEAGGLAILVSVVAGLLMTATFLRTTWMVTSALALPYTLLVVTMGALLCVAFWGLFLKQEGSRASSGSWGGMLVGILIAFIITLGGRYGGPEFLTRLILSGGALLTGTLIFQRARRLKRQGFPVPSPERAQYHWQNALNTLGIGFPMALLIMSQVVPIGLNLILIVTKGIPALSAYEGNSYFDQAMALAAMAISPPEIVRTVYSTHAQFLLGTLLVIFVAEAILLGGLRLVLRLAGQRA